MLLPLLIYKYISAKGRTRRVTRDQYKITARVATNEKYHTKYGKGIA